MQKNVRLPSISLVHVVLLLSLIILFAYYKLFHTFYQQDEWIALGHVYAEGTHAFVSNYSLLDALFGKGRLIALPIIYGIFRYFPLNMLPFAVFGIVLHTINAFLVYLITHELTQERGVPILSAVLFSIASIGSQAVVWAAASTTTLPTAACTFFSILVYLRYLRDGKTQLLVLSFLSAVVGFLFKESALTVFALFPFLYLLYGRKGKRSVAKFIRSHWFIVMYLVSVVVYRLIDLFTRVNTVASKFVENGAHPKLTILHNIFWYPFVALSQSYIHQELMFRMADVYERLNYSFILVSNLHQLVAENIVADLLSAVFSSAIIFLFINIAISQKRTRKLIVFIAVFLVLSFLPYVVLARSNAYLESRYYYIGTMASAIAFSLLLSWLNDWLGKKNVLLGCLVAAGIGITFIVYEMTYIRDQLNVQVAVAKERNAILKEISRKRTELPVKPVFYITSDRGYYTQGQPLPFQQGIGYTLMVLLYDTGKIPAQLLKQDFLWNMESEGYQEVDSGGFGFFSSWQALTLAVKEYKLNPEQIAAYSYNGKYKVLTDISAEVRAQLTGSPEVHQTQ